MLNQTATDQSRKTLRHARSRVAPAAILLVAFALFAGAGGCGTNLSDLLFQSATAAGNTAFDLLLTDFANQVADAFDRPPDDGSADDGADTGGDDDVSDDGDDGVNGDGDGLPAGDAIAGEQAYLDTGCNVCHGDSGEGVSAPALAGMNELSALQTRFGGGASHFGNTLSDQDVEDVATWLLGL